MRKVYSLIRRVKITGKQCEAGKAFQWLEDQGFHVTRSGPFTNKNLWPDVDPARFLILAERPEPPEPQ